MPSLFQPWQFFGLRTGVETDYGMEMRPKKIACHYLPLSSDVWLGARYD